MNRELKRHIRQGQASYEARDYDEAYHQFSLAIQGVEQEDGDCFMSDSEVAELYLTRGAILAAQDEAITLKDPDIFHQVMEDYDQAIEICPSQFYYRNLRGRMYLKCTFEDYTDRAIEEFAYVLKHDPKDFSALKHMGQVYSQKHQYQKAIGFFTKCLEIREDKELFLLRAVCFFKRTPPDFEAAIADFGQALKHLPRLEELYVWRSQCFQELGKLEEAVTEYDRLLEINPGEAGYYVDRGVLRSTIDPEGALEDYDRAIEIGNHPLAYNNRACHFLGLGEYETAIADAQAALEFDPDCHIAYATLAEIFAMQHNDEQFYAYFPQALEHYYDDIIDVLETPAFATYMKDQRFLKLIGRPSVA